MDESGSRSRSHGIAPDLLKAQADALGAEMRFYETSWKSYEERFVATLRAARADGIAHAIFGDIDLAPHREWEEKVSAQAGVHPCLPLWDEPREKLVAEFLSLGFKAVVVCVNGDYLGEEFCGREFSADFVADLPAGVDPCGENGEFHTFAHDGPAFARPVAFRRGERLSARSPAGAGAGAATFHFQALVPTAG